MSRSSRPKLSPGPSSLSGVVENMGLPTTVARFTRIDLGAFGGVTKPPLSSLLDVCDSKVLFAASDCSFGDALGEVFSWLTAVSMMRK